jgi:hypothetical protein
MRCRHRLADGGFHTDASARCWPRSYRSRTSSADPVSPGEPHEANAETVCHTDLLAVSLAESETMVAIPRSRRRAAMASDLDRLRSERTATMRMAGDFRRNVEQIEVVAEGHDSTDANGDADPGQ